MADFNELSPRADARFQVVGASEQHSVRTRRHDGPGIDFARAPTITMPPLPDEPNFLR
jgi:hypothetical protein